MVKKQNMLIHGENLLSLAVLAAGSGTSKHHFSVDVIYIDPPYNVGGNQGYRNTWKGVSEKERDWAGDHGAFLDFMEPRLKIGRQLLREDGVFFVSICDGEYCRLKILMDLIFGEGNCVGTFIWNKKQGSTGRNMTVSHEYVLAYAKDITKFVGLSKAKGGATLILEKAKQLKTSGLEYEKAQKEFKDWIKKAEKSGDLSRGEAAYNMLHPLTFEPFQSVSIRAQDRPESRCQKPLRHPITRKFCELPKNGWSLSEKTLFERASFDKYHIGDSFVVAGQIVYGKTEKNVPRKYLPLSSKTHMAPPSIIEEGYGGDRDLPEGITFSTPKPVSFIRSILSLVNKRNISVLDYFAGSGTTAHAVHQLNEADGGERSWIMIEEMASTFHNVLLPRIKSFDEQTSFSVFELTTADAGDKSLMKMFGQYSFDFLSAYHQVSDEHSIMAEGLDKSLLSGGK